MPRLLLPVRSTFLVLALAGTAGCNTDPSAVDLNGVWGRPFSIPGASWATDLEEHGGVVTGHGCFTVEAGPAGTLTATGTRQAGAGSVTITTTITTQPGVAPTTETFKFRILDQDHLTLSDPSVAQYDLVRGGSTLGPCVGQPSGSPPAPRAV